MGKSTFVATVRGVLQQGQRRFRSVNCSPYSQPGRTTRGYSHPHSQFDKTKGYHVRLSDRAVEVVDTHGLAESLGTDTFRASLLHFLAETDKAAFFPPLVMLQTLSEVEIELLKEISAVFSEVVVVSRQENSSELGLLQEYVRLAGIKPINAFHVRALCHGRSREARFSRDVYARDVAKILNFYQTVTPSRGKLNFSSSMLAGTTLREMCARKEVKTELVQPGHENGVLEGEDRRLCLFLAEELARLTAHLRALRRANPVIAVIVSIGSLFTHLGSAIFGALGSERDEENSVPLVTQRRTSQRRVYELWRKPGANIEIFMRYEFEPWSVVSEEPVRQGPRQRRFRPAMVHCRS